MSWLFEDQEQTLPLGRGMRNSGVLALPCSICHLVLALTLYNCYTVWMEWFVVVGIKILELCLPGSVGSSISEFRVKVNVWWDPAAGAGGLFFIWGRLRTWGQFSIWQLLHANLNQVV